MGSAYSVLPLLVVTALLAGTPFAAPPEVQHFSTLAVSNAPPDTPVSLSKSNKLKPEVVEERLNMENLKAGVGSMIKKVSSSSGLDSESRRIKDVLTHTKSARKAFDVLHTGSTPFEDIAARLTALVKAESSPVYEKDLKAAKKAVRAAKRIFRRDIKVVEGALKLIYQDKKVVADRIEALVKNPPLDSAAVGDYENLVPTNGLPQKIVDKFEVSKQALAHAESKISELNKKIVDVESARKEFELAVSSFFDNAAFLAWYKKYAKPVDEDAPRGNAVYLFLVEQFGDNPWVAAAVIDSMRRKWGTAGSVAKELEIAQFRSWVTYDKNLKFHTDGLPLKGRRDVPASVFLTVQDQFVDFQTGRNRFMSV
uniref:RxLR effector candidate protein n=1 Tax=Peronospora matthiolae TaxID=2874970 RepID=A0AAV1TPP8_9STRA